MSRLIIFNRLKFQRVSKRNPSMRDLYYIIIAQWEVGGMSLSWKTFN